MRLATTQKRIVHRYRHIEQGSSVREGLLADRRGPRGSNSTNWLGQRGKRCKL